MYSDEEKKAAVEELVKGTVRRLYGALGNRQANLSFSDLQDAVAGLFISKPRVPYALLGTGVGRASARVAALRTTLAKAASDAMALIRRVNPPTRINELGRAAAALSTLDSATRTQNLQQGTSPGVQQFREATQRFLDKDGALVREEGEIVPAPAEAKLLVSTGVAGVLKELSALEADLAYLCAAREVLDGLALPATLSGTVVANAANSLQEEYARLLGMSGAEQLSNLRGTVLKVLAARATVEGFVTKPPQGLYVYPGGRLEVLASTTYPATPASLLTLPGPYNLYDTQVPPLFATPSTRLSLLVDGDPYEVQLPESYVAQLDSSFAGIFNFNNPDGSPPPERRYLRVYLDDELLASADMLTSTWPAQEVALYLNQQLATPYLRVTQYLRAVSYQGVATLSTPDSGLSWVATLPTGTWAVLGVAAGNTILVDDPTEPTGHAFTVVSVTDSSATLALVPVENRWLLSFLHLPAAGVFQVSAGAGVGVRMLFADSYAMTSIGYEGRFSVEGDLAERLGWQTGAPIYSLGVQAEPVATFLTRSSALQKLGEPVLSAKKEWVTRSTEQLVTEPDDPTRVRSLLLTSTSSVTWAGEIGTAVLPLTEAALLAAAPSPVFRITSCLADPALLGVSGLVNSVNTSTGAVQFRIPHAAGTVPGVTFEFGRAFPYVAGGWALKIESGPNAGDYMVERYAGDAASYMNDPLERWVLRLLRPLAVPASSGNKPVSLTGLLGGYGVRLSTLDTGKPGSIEARVTSSATAATQLFGFSAARAVNQSNWLSVDSTTGVEIGDTIELCTTSIVSPSSSYTIDRLGTGAVHVAESVGVDFPGYAAAAGSQLPFVRIRKAHIAGFDQLVYSLSTWGEQQPTAAVRQTRFDAVMTPIAANAHPVPAQVSDLITYISDLDAQLALLEPPLTGYKAEQSSEAQSLVQAYTEKGATRALELLYYGRFDEFFGLDANTATRLGAVQVAVQQVARNDLPVDRYGRPTYGQKTLTASQDPDIDKSDDDTGDDS